MDGAFLGRVIVDGLARHFERSAIDWDQFTLSSPSQLRFCPRWRCALTSRQPSPTSWRGSRVRQVGRTAPWGTPIHNIAHATPVRC